MDLEPSVDLAALAPLTEGFSGADLQALMYNAHLEGVHLALERTGMSTASSNSDSLTRFVVLRSNGNTLSQAEQSALNARVRRESQSPGSYSHLRQIQQIMRGTQPKPTTKKVDAQSHKVRPSRLHNMWC